MQTKYNQLPQTRKISTTLSASKTHSQILTPNIE